jgi:site-specific DNA recombinase
MNRITESPTKVKPARVAFLRRVSSQEQAQDGNSLDTQLSILQGYAKINDWQIAGDFVDAGYSGSTDERPGLQSLMSAARAHEFDIVAVTKLDRFFRNLRLLKNYLFELDNLGIGFIAAQESLDTSTAPGRLMLNMVGSFAEFERERIGERLKDTRTHLAAQGQWSSGRTPYGYRFNKATKELVVDPVEGEGVRFIFNAYLNNEIGIVRTAVLCNEQGIITPRLGRRKHTTWTQSAVRHILTHPAYKGGPNEGWPFRCPAIIKSELWDMALRQLANHRHFRATDTHSPYQGLLRCGLCHHTLRTGYNHGGQGGKVWECPGRLLREHLDGSPRCNLPRFSADRLEANLSNEVMNIFNNPNILIGYIDQTIKNLSKEREALERNLRPIRGDVKRIKEAMGKADTMFELSRLSADEYKARIAGLRARLAEFERQTDEVDPMLLEKIADNERLTKYWQTLRNMAEPGSIFNELFGNVNENFPGTLTFLPDPEILEHPEVIAAQQLRKLGLYAYVHPNKIEVKGSIRPTSVTSGCKSARCPQSQ